MNKQYYTPNIEDLHIGYEAELQIITKAILFNGKYSEELAEFKIEPIRNGYDLEYLRVNPDRIRTLYLTKEQIEKEGWIYKNKSIDIWFEKEGSFNRENNYTIYKLKMHYNLQDKWMSINIDDRGEDMCIFNGKINSINEFKQIMKL